MLLRPRARAHAPKHLKPGRTGRLLAAGTIVGVVAAAELSTAGAASAATSSDFAKLRQCESSGNYSVNTGNGYYGAYQFDLGTWHGLGYSGRPDQASHKTQDAAAAKLQKQRGWSPWPACSKRLHLGSSSSSAKKTPARKAPAAKQVHRAVTHAPAFSGHVISTKDRQQHRSDVATWQKQMKARGWHLAVDGHFGPKSAGIAKSFAAEKGLHPHKKGTVDKAVWTAAWTARVS